MDIAVIGSNMVDLIAYITRMPAEGETVEGDCRRPSRRGSTDVKPRRQRHLCRQHHRQLSRERHRHPLHPEKPGSQRRRTHFR